MIVILENPIAEGQVQPVLPAICRILGGIGSVLWHRLANIRNFRSDCNLSAAERSDVQP